MDTPRIVVRGARQHNLKGIDLELPRNRLIVITGLSGSGKSSLAFDTLYAESQRRYVESLSTYARQFLARMEKPDVDHIVGLSPAIAIEQKTASHNPRSTVGTVTEIYDYLRLLYARVGTLYCPQCDRPVESQTLDQIIDVILDLAEGTRIIILAPMVRNEKGAHQKLLNRLRRDGFARVRIDGKIADIEEVGKLNPRKPHSLEVVVDRLVVRRTIRNRLADSLELASSLAEGHLIVDIDGGAPILFSETAMCPQCQIRFEDLTPASFSFNSPQGACSTCDGLGSVTEFDQDLIIPNQQLSLREGAVLPWAHRNSMHFVEFLDALTRRYRTDIYTPYKDLPARFKEVLLFGSGMEEIPFYFEQGNRRYTNSRPFEGLIPNLQRRYTETESGKARDEIRQYMTFHPCPDCNGARLKKTSMAVRVGDQTIQAATSLSISKIRSFFTELEITGKKGVIADRIVREIIERLAFLEDVGLDYLTLDRSAHTLSGGESQRIRLATQIGSKLTGVLYVLDEPSIGLHQRDNQRLLKTLLHMRDLGNTVLVVEHDEDTIRAADFVVDMGPGAGINGGDVVFAGAPDELARAPHSLTGQYLSGKRFIELPSTRRQRSEKMLLLNGASKNNLKQIDVEFPLGLFICVTGVSGSGKSTLVIDTLYHALSQRLYHSRIQAGAHTDIKGIGHVDKVIHIDQSPIGKTPRSNPGTYTGVFNFIRDLFARTPDSRMRGYKPGRFSFNVKGGRCEACGGDGILKIEMHFLPDIFVTCDVCHGKRYNRETLEIRYKGKTIADVLDMTVNQAFAFFKNIEAIRTRLKTLVDVGVGYVRLGQRATTLSGGEAQRVKLARELSKRATGNTIYVLDEPTTGLHTDDIRKLLDVLNQLVNAGNTVVVIEHNLDVIKCADYLIDLGLEGGDRGGEVIGTGTPEQIADLPGSYTGQYLKTVLHRKSS